jgi:hypothetical protein
VLVEVTACSQVVAAGRIHMLVETSKVKNRVQRVVKVPPILLSLKFLSTSVTPSPPITCFTCHPFFENLKKRIMLTFTPNVLGENVDLQTLLQSITRLYWEAIHDLKCL